MVFLPNLMNNIKEIIMSILSFHNATCDSYDHEKINQRKAHSQLTGFRKVDVARTNCEIQKSIDDGINLQRNSKISTNNIETLKRRYISPVFKKYLPESPKATEFNSFENCLQSLIHSSYWDLNVMPSTSKSEPLVQSVVSTNDNSPYSSLSDCFRMKDNTGQNTGCDTGTKALGRQYHNRYFLIQSFLFFSKFSFHHYICYVKIRSCDF